VKEDTGIIRMKASSPSRPLPSLFAHVETGLPETEPDESYSRALSTTGDNIKRSALIGASITKHCREAWAARGLYKVVLDAEVRAGLRAGEYTWNGVKATVHDAASGKIVKQIKVQKVTSVMSRALFNAVGEFQLAQILAAIERVEEKVDRILQEMEVGRRAGLNAAISMIRASMLMSEPTNRRCTLLNTVYPLSEAAEEYILLAELNNNKQVEKKLWLDILHSRTAEKAFNKDLGAWVDGQNACLQGYTAAMLALAEVYGLLGETQARPAQFERCRRQVDGMMKNLSARVNYQTHILTDVQRQYDMKDVIDEMRRRDKPGVRALADACTRIQQNADMCLSVTDHDTCRKAHIECVFAAKRSVKELKHE